MIYRVFGLVYFYYCIFEEKKTMASAETFWRLDHNITKHDVDGSIALGYRKFRSFFGTSSSVCAAACDNLSHVRPIKSRPEHLLWTLLHLKHYATEQINSALVGVSEKKFRKWCHIFVRLLTEMPVVGDNIKILGFIDNANLFSFID